MSDLEIFKKGEFYKLYMKYMPFVEKHWEKMKKSYSFLSSEDKKDFFSDSYIAFMEAVKYVKLEKIYDEKWKFLGVYGYYLSNLRRTWRRNLKSRLLEVPLLRSGKDKDYMITNIQFNNDISNLIDFKNFLSEEEKKFTDLLKEKASINDIKKELGFKNNYQYYSFKKKLKEKIKEFYLKN